MLLERELPLASLAEYAREAAHGEGRLVLVAGELRELCGAREELFDALLRQVSELVALNVVVIEDVHWADEAGIDLLRFLGRRLRNSGVLLVATYRDGGLPASHPLRLALGELASQRSARRIGLAPLSATAVGVLAGGSGLEAAPCRRVPGRCTRACRRRPEPGAAQQESRKLGIFPRNLGNCSRSPPGPAAIRSP